NTAFTSPISRPSTEKPNPRKPLAVGNRSVGRDKTTAKPPPRPEARGQKVRDPPVRDHRGVTLGGRRSEGRVRERHTDSRAAGLRQRGGEGEIARAFWQRDAVVVVRELGGAHRPAGDGPAIEAANQHLLLHAGEG